MDNFLCSPLMYYITTQVVKESALNSVPFGGIRGVLKGIDNVFFSNRQLKNSQDFFLVDEVSLQKIADLYMKRRVSLPEGADFLYDRIKSRFLQGIELSQQMIQKLNESYGREVKLCVGLKKGFRLGRVGFATVGIGKEAIILYSPNEQIIDKVPEIQDPREVEKEEEQFWNMILPRRAHVLAHEFSHINNRGNLKTLSIRVLASVVNLIMWLQIVNVSYGLIPVPYVFFRCFVVQSGFSLLRIFLTRTQEMRGDKEGMDYLGTNDGAISLLSTLEKMEGSQKDIYHPSPSIRLEAAKNWKK